jgi:peroxiredoxin
MLTLVFMRLVPIACATLLCSALLWGQTGRRAPGFSLPDANNQQHDLLDYRGRVVIVDIMRTDCPECRPFAKTLEEIKTHYGGKVAVIAITNPPDTPAKVRQFVAEFKVSYPILFDCGQVAFSFVLPNPLRPSINIPHAYLIDREGVIRGDYEFGADTREIFVGSGLYKEIDRVLAAKPERKH